MSKKAILCLDDERIILTSLQDQLFCSFGDLYIYEFAESIEEAWEVIKELQQARINIVLVVPDWLLTKKREDNFLFEVKHKFPSTVIILLTGQIDNEKPEPIQHYSYVHDCLVKPWDAINLITTVQSGIEQIDLEKSNCLNRK